MERRNVDREFREGAVRIVRETGKPIAQVARELRLHSATLGRWVNLDRRAREGEGPLSESERDELNRLRKENAELAEGSPMAARPAAELALLLRAEAGPRAPSTPTSTVCCRPRTGQGGAASDHVDKAHDALRVGRGQSAQRAATGPVRGAGEEAGRTGTRHGHRRPQLRRKQGRPPAHDLGVKNLAIPRRGKTVRRAARQKHRKPFRR